MENNGPLKGLVVADFSQLAQGPWATQMLGDMGAEIIKIEPPKGDWMRHYSYGNIYPEGESDTVHNSVSALLLKIISSQYGKRV